MALLASLITPHWYSRFTLPFPLGKFLNLNTSARHYAGKQFHIVPGRLVFSQIPNSDSFFTVTFLCKVCNEAALDK